MRGLRVNGAMKLIMRLVLGWKGPRRRVLGSVFSGEVESIGSQVTKFTPGDLVFGITGMKFGAHAEFLCISENGIVMHKPKNASHVQAASLPFGALTSKYFIEKHEQHSLDKSILIYGASGAVGTAAVQIAKQKGMLVTAVCSAKNTEFVKQLGADVVWAYDQQDITQKAQKFSLIFDAVGKVKKQEMKDLLTDKGKFFTVEGLDIAKDRLSDLEELCKLYETGKYKAVVDQTFGIENIVEAHRYIDTGRKKGNVLITFN